jgi:predicted alpha/beta superfamily hydrolase
MNFKISNIYICVLILSGSFCSLFSQQSYEPIVIGNSISLESTTLNEARKILVYTPPSYDQNNKRYPTLYLLEAEYAFHYTTGIVHFLAEIDYIPELIVVGITNGDRNRDLTPEPGENEKVRFPTSGGADNFLNFIQQEVIPYIDSNYYTSPYRILVGHSLGGLFAIYTLLREANVFDAVIASSPSLYWNNQIQLSNAKTLLRNRDSFNRSLFITMGSERDEMVKSAQQFSKILDQYAPKDFFWKFENMPNEIHSTTPFISIKKGFEFIFSDFYQVQNLYSVHFSDYYKHLETKYGYKILLPIGFIYEALEYYGKNRLFADGIDVLEYMSANYSEAFKSKIMGYVEIGNQLISESEYEYAIRLFQLIIKANGSLYRAYRGLGDAYQLSGNAEAALENYQRSLELNPGDQEIRQKMEVLKNKN